MDTPLCKGMEFLMRAGARHGWNTPQRRHENTHLQGMEISKENPRSKEAWKPGGFPLKEDSCNNPARYTGGTGAALAALHRSELPAFHPIPSPMPIPPDSRFVSRCGIAPHYVSPSPQTTIGTHLRLRLETSAPAFSPDQ